MNFGTPSRCRPSILAAVQIVAVFFASFLASPARSDAQQVQWSSVPYRMELPAELREYYRNFDSPRGGSCVQCSIGMCGMWVGNYNAATLLWDSDYGDKVIGGSYPSRVENYARERGLKIYNVTGSSTFDWMKWSAKTGRFAAIGAGTAHFQTLVGYNPEDQTWYVCNNNSPQKIDRYTDQQFRRLHLASGAWVVILDDAPAPAVPQYLKWW